MSRIGKLPIKLISDVVVELSGLTVTVNGPRGRISKVFDAPIKIESTGDSILVVPTNDTVFARSMWGTVRSIVHNMVYGVSTGFVIRLIIQGVGYRAAVRGQYLNLTLGKSHNTKVEILRDIDVKIVDHNIIELTSCDKEKLGQYAALIRNQRAPEPYKGKGIRREGEYVQRKEGKKG